MRNKIILFLCFFQVIKIPGQITYDSQNINLVSHIDPQSTVGIGTDNRKYSGCWGWVQTSTNKEYAILGSSAGTYFVDISTPTNPVVCAFVPGKTGCTWREIKTYQNYCYVVSDDAAPNQFQIIDMSPLPSTVNLVYSGNNEYFERGHTIFIDKDKMYIGSQTKVGGAYDAMTVYSLATPTNPIFLRSLETDVSVSIVHDMFVNNDTVFASCGNAGLFIYKLKPDTTFTQIGSFINYHSGSAYNHSSYITEDRKHLVFTDEVPSSIPIKVLDIQNIGSPVISATINAHPMTTPHNPYVVGSRWAIVSCYQDGLNIFDLYDPTNPILSGYFDTYYESGFNTSDYSTSPYRGNWGAYPFFPSGYILALDMQNGMYLLDASDTYSQPAGIKGNELENRFFNLYPNPSQGTIYLKSNINETITIELTDITGKLVHKESFVANGINQLNVKQLEPGTYIATIIHDGVIETHKKIIIEK